jgi:hypothetical protein
MGSFYSSCSITSMTLKHQNVARFLLVPSLYTHGYDSRDALKEKGLLVSNEGALAIFSPFGFAIRGKYDDYGDLKEIERDFNVEALEKFFNIPIEEILSAAQDDRWYTLGIDKPLENKNNLKAAKETLDSLVEKYEKNDKPSSRNKISKAISEIKDKIRALEDEVAYDDGPYGIASWGLKGDPQNIEILRLLTFSDIRGEIYDELGKKVNRDTYWDEITKKRNKDYFAKLDLRVRIRKYMSECRTDGRYNKIYVSEEDFKVFKKFVPDLEKDDITALDFMTLSWKKPEGFLRNNQYNFMDLLNYGVEAKEQYMELQNAVINIGKLNKCLMPSAYGRQEDNYKYLMKINNLANQLMLDDLEDEED